MCDNIGGKMVMDYHKCKCNTCQQGLHAPNLHTGHWGSFVQDQEEYPIHSNFKQWLPLSIHNVTMPAWNLLNIYVYIIYIDHP